MLRAMVEVGKGYNTHQELRTAAIFTNTTEQRSSENGLTKKALLQTLSRTDVSIYTRVPYSVSHINKLVPPCVLARVHACSVYTHGIPMRKQDEGKRYGVERRQGETGKDRICIHRCTGAIERDIQSRLYT